MLSLERGSKMASAKRALLCVKITKDICAYRWVGALLQHFSIQRWQWHRSDVLAGDSTLILAGSHRHAEQQGDSRNNHAISWRSGPMSSAGPYFPLLWAGVTAAAILAYVLMDGWVLGVGILYPLVARQT